MQLKLTIYVFSRKVWTSREIAKTQENDDFIQSLLKDASTSILKLEEIKMDNSDQILLCIVSISKVRPIIPKKFRKLDFDKVHGTLHPEIKATRCLIQRRLVWKNTKKDTSNCVKCCDQCQKGKVIRHNKSLYSQFTIPFGRFENLHVDIVGPLLFCNVYKYILTIIARFSCWFTAIAMRDNRRINCGRILEWVDSTFWLSKVCYGRSR